MNISVALLSFNILVNKRFPLQSIPLAAQVTETGLQIHKINKSVCPKLYYKKKSPENKRDYCGQNARGNSHVFARFLSNQHFFLFPSFFFTTRTEFLYGQCMYHLEILKYFGEHSVAFRNECEFLSRKNKAFFGESDAKKFEASHPRASSTL